MAQSIHCANCGSQILSELDHGSTVEVIVTRRNLAGSDIADAEIFRSFEYLCMSCTESDEIDADIDISGIGGDDE